MSRIGRAFTFVETMIVVLIIGILAAVVVPRFAGVSEDARSSAAQGALGSVRTSIAGFRTRAVISGSDPFPTLAQLVSPGAVLQGDFPVNPYNGLSSVQQVSQGQASARSVSATETYGWNYFVDNSADPPVAVFYANTIDETRVSDGAGGVKTANEL